MLSRSAHLGARHRCPTGRGPVRRALARSRSTNVAHGPGGYHAAVRTHLNLDDLAVIACAPPTATAAELARQLGLGRDLNHSHGETRTRATVLKWRPTLASV